MEFWRGLWESEPEPPPVHPRRHLPGPNEPLPDPSPGLSRLLLFVNVLARHKKNCKKHIDVLRGVRKDLNAISYQETILDREATIADCRSTQSETRKYMKDWRAQHGWALNNDAVDTMLAEESLDIREWMDFLGYGRKKLLDMQIETREAEHNLADAFSEVATMLKRLTAGSGTSGNTGRSRENAGGMDSPCTPRLPTDQHENILGGESRSAQRSSTESHGLMQRLSGDSQRTPERELPHSGPWI
ncbi:hypothetical protein BDV96DRAFT_650340 [Lophiotrema nucula]|uniref:Uncharacterized protein n=1 Tax=Lophiotrema nucula TaxID=690887 RepID=A0A6A5YWA6_9PLEO|nr:hypothetical protein BDV96DRAFT_650340 [Lophiotrema nucula]